MDGTRYVILFLEKYVNFGIFLQLDVGRFIGNGCSFPEISAVVEKY
jgi:hypothetical protein